MSSTSRGMVCSEALERFHQVLDGDLMDAADRTRMESHLAVCSECAEAAEQLRELQDVLRGFAETSLPDSALQHVWERSIRSEDGAGRRSWLDWRFAAAAAMIVFGTWIGASWYPGAPPGHDDAEALQAAREVRMVLQLTANAINRSKQVAIKEVFTDEISPAFRKVGVRWPQAPTRAVHEEAEL